MSTCRSLLVMGKGRKRRSPPLPCHGLSLAVVVPGHRRFVLLLYVDVSGKSA